MAPNPEQDQRERDLMAAHLDGYLSAAAAVSGAVHEFSMGASLVPLEATNVEAALGRYAGDLECRLSALTRGASWTELETWLRTRLLSAPFGIDDPQTRQAAAASRRYLAWKATDLAMFLSPDHKPGEIHYFSLEWPDAVMSEGCCISYAHDLLVVTSTRFGPESGAGPSS